MNRWIRSIMAIGLSSIAVCASADEYDDIAPYLGADFKQSYMKGHGAWKSIFPGTYPGAAFYVGTKFHQYFAIELGYDWSMHQKKEWSLPAGSAFFATPVQGTEGSTRVERNGAYLDVLGLLPIADCLEMMGSIGMGWVQTKIESNFSTMTTPESSALASVAGKGRTVLRVGIGASYMVTDVVGVRAKMGWEGTSALKLVGNQAFSTYGYDTKGFKGTTAFSAGAFFKF